MKTKTSKHMKWAVALMMLNVIMMIPSVIQFFIPDLYTGLYLENYAGMTNEELELMNEGVYKTLCLFSQAVGFSVIGMHIMMTPITLIPFKRGEKWAWFTLLALWGFNWITNAVLEALSQEYSMVYYSIIPLIAAVTALILSYPKVFKEKNL